MAMNSILRVSTLAALAALSVTAALAAPAAKTRDRIVEVSMRIHELETSDLDGRSPGGILTRTTGLSASSAHESYATVIVPADTNHDVPALLDRSSSIQTSARGTTCDGLTLPIAVGQTQDVVDRVDVTFKNDDMIARKRMKKLTTGFSAKFTPHVGKDGSVKLDYAYSQTNLLEKRPYGVQLGIPSVDLLTLHRSGIVSDAVLPEDKKLLLMSEAQNGKAYLIEIMATTRKATDPRGVAAECASLARQFKADTKSELDL